MLQVLQRTWPQATCELDHHSPFQLLVATILSAQTTDKRVNQVTPGLFARYPDAAALAGADQPELQQLIHSTGFFRAKARNITAMAQRLVEHHQGNVPPRMGDLVELPGVARKTANVVLGTAFGMNEGVVVDTHVHRVSQRLRLTRADEPAEIEQDLMVLAPRERWTALGHQLIWHGRRICHARDPDCGNCPLAPLCPEARI
ncbi:MAG TPA: endonuclease III [Kofleriaceae bacterium]|nr:endonuclease III [Kofleriaceae bacterium]